MRISILFLCAAFCLVSCHGESKPSSNVNPQDTSVVNIAKFVSLDFELGGKICTATINQNYVDYKNKSEFPLSLFITINTIDKKADGLPTDKENLKFNEIESEILSQLASKATYRYIGRTRMDGYRDMIFYISEKDQKNTEEELKAIQKKESRLKEYTFEKDPKWEAVNEFYEALKAKK